MGKEENAHYQHFSSCPTMFSKDNLHRSLFCGKGLNMVFFPIRVVMIKQYVGSIELNEAEKKHLMTFIT